MRCDTARTRSLATAIDSPGSSRAVMAENRVVEIRRDVHVRCESEADERAVISWKDPDNGVRLPFEADRPPDERWITIEVCAPELVIQHGHFIGVGLDDASPVSYGQTEDAEVILRDGEREHRSCLLAIVEVGDNSPRSGRRPRGRRGRHGASRTHQDWRGCCRRAEPRQATRDR